LVLDDSPFDAEAIMIQCDAVGYHTTVVGTPEEAVKYLATAHVDLMLIDYHQPAPFEFADFLDKRVRSQVAVAVVSADDKIELIFNCIHMLFLSGYFIKPISAAQVRTLPRLAMLHKQAQLQYLHIHNTTVYDRLTGANNTDVFSLLRRTMAGRFTVLLITTSDPDRVFIEEVCSAVGWGVSFRVITVSTEAELRRVLRRRKRIDRKRSQQRERSFEEAAKDGLVQMASSTRDARLEESRARTARAAGAVGRTGGLEGAVGAVGGIREREAQREQQWHDSATESTTSSMTEEGDEGTRTTHLFHAQPTSRCHPQATPLTPNFPPTHDSSLLTERDDDGRVDVAIVDAEIPQAFMLMALEACRDQRQHSSTDCIHTSSAAVIEQGVPVVMLKPTDNSSISPQIRRRTILQQQQASSATHNRAGMLDLNQFVTTCVDCSLAIGALRKPFSMADARLLPHFTSLYRYRRCAADMGGAAEASAMNQPTTHVEEAEGVARGESQ
jgi:CheY-like chemotaxis protein